MNRNRPLRRASPRRCRRRPLAAFPASASSHREAPFIATQPQVDATDFYMFRSYEPGRDGYVTLIANYMPLQDAVRRPELLQARPERPVRDPRRQRRRRARGPDVPVPVPATARRQRSSIVGGKHGRRSRWCRTARRTSASPRSPALNVVETYTVDVDPRRRAAPARRQPVTNATTGRDDVRQAGRQHRHQDDPGLRRLRATAHLATIAIPGCARQRPRVRRPAQGSVRRQPRRDLRPGQHQVPGGRAESARPSRDASTRWPTRTSPRSSLEVPIACLTEGKGTVIGGWTTASVPANAQLDRDAGRRPRRRRRRPASCVQVSRLGMPLVNEVVIGLKDKNRFNASEPKDDGAVRRLRHQPDAAGAARDPVRRARASGADQLPAHRPGRGVPDRHRRRSTSRPNVVASEMLRLNTAIAPTPKGRAEPPRRARRRQRRLPERPPAGRRRGRHRAARRDGRAVHAQHRRLHAGRRAGGRAALHRRRVHLRRRSSPSEFPYLRAPLQGLAERGQRGQAAKRQR